MRKSTRIVKRLLALFLVVLMSIESFGAVVSDNDGSAFITKAEFDSLKNDFQSQIDQYNTSIDSKIDGAIASYLSGISLEKKSSKPILVSNYNQMRWINKFKVYGKYKRWTSLDNYTSYSDIWFTPQLCERRANLRVGRFNIFDTLDLGIGLASLFAEATIQMMSGGLMMQRGAYVGASGYAQTAPVFAIELKKKNETWVINEDRPFRNHFCFAYQAYGQIRTPERVEGEMRGYQFASAPIYFVTDSEPMQVETPDNNEIFKYLVYLSNGTYHPVTHGNVTKFRMIMTTNNAYFPISYAEQDPYSDCGFNASTKAVAPEAGWNQGHEDAIDAGVTWHRLINTNQNTLMKYMMFGTNDDIRANLTMPLGGMAEGRYFDVSTSNGSSILNANIVTVNIDNFKQSRAGGSDYLQRKTGLSIPMTLNIPDWPQDKISNIANGQFEFNGNYLKVGQGLPLVTDIDKSGYLQITFDYDVKYILDEQSKNKQILISIKKDDFNTDNNKYCSGYLDLVNPNATTKTVYTLKDKTFENTDGKVKLTIPVEKDDNLWLRVAPQNNTGGYYATINNLNITYVTE